MFLRECCLSIVRFFHFARKHRIQLKPRDWYKGVLLLLLGWGLLGFDSVMFKGNFNGIDTKINFVIQFTVGLIFLILARLAYSLFKLKTPDVWSFFKITQSNEISGSAILSPSQRRRLIHTRAIIGAAGYIGFQLAKIAIGTIDNTIIYGADGLMYAVMAIGLLKEKYNKFEWIGILMAFFGVATLVRFDIMTGDHAIWGGILGIFSSASLAIILILTSIIVQHDHPVRIAFYQCLWGLIIALCVLAFSWKGLIQSDFSLIDLKDSIIEGVLYAAALICFFQAFYYVSPIIVAVSSYSLDIYVIILVAIINKEFMSLFNGLSILLISIGGVILIREEFKKEKEEKHSE